MTLVDESGNEYNVVAYMSTEGLLGDMRAFSGWDGLLERWPNHTAFVFLGHVRIESMLEIKEALRGKPFHAYYLGVKGGLVSFTGGPAHVTEERPEPDYHPGIHDAFLVADLCQTFTRGLNAITPEDAPGKVSFAG